MADRSVDPYKAFQFLLELGADIAGSFTECSGLQVETDFEEYQEGGENRYRHKLPKTSKYGNLTLRRGLTTSTALWDWYDARAQEDFKGAGKRRSAAVILWDGNVKTPVWRWDFRDAYPVKWTGPDLKAESGTLAIEALELAHNGIVSAGPP